MHLIASVARAALRLVVFIVFDPEQLRKNPPA